MAENMIGPWYRDLPRAYKLLLIGLVMSLPFVFISPSITFMIVTGTLGLALGETLSAKLSQA